MDGLEEFEKALAAEKSERERAAQEKEEKRERKHRHNYRHRERSPEQSKGGRGDRDARGREGDRDASHHHRHRGCGPEDDGHRHKRSRQSREEDDMESRHRHKHKRRDHDRDHSQDRNHREPRDVKDIKQSDPKLDLPLPDEEKTPSVESRPAKPLARDAWMTDPSAVEIDYVHRRDKRSTDKPPPKQGPELVIHRRELNAEYLAGLRSGKSAENSPIPPAGREVDYTFGDEGSQWRMIKLEAAYTEAEQSDRPVEEVALERFGTVREFDEAREEKEEMDRRKRYGDGYRRKEKPTGELHQVRHQTTGFRTKHRPPEQDVEPEPGKAVDNLEPPAERLDQSTLNRLRAQMLKAKIRGGSEAVKLEAEYEAASASFSATGSGNGAVVLDARHSRMLAGSRGEVKTVDTKRGRERGQVEQNEDMSINDMVREERRTRGQAGGEGMRLAERIAKDAKFDDDLEYLDENAEKLAKRVHRSEASLKNVAVADYQKLNQILDKCPLCHHEDRAPPRDQPLAPVVSLATRVFLTLPTEPELTGADGGAVIVPINHRANLLECDDDEWEEMRNFMKSLTRLYHEQGREVIFYENAAAPQRHLHAALVAVPIPYDLGDTAPAFFKEAMLSTDEEWTQHKKIIDTGKRAKDGLGKLAFRRSIAKEMPYFHVWFTLDGGLGHIVEDSERWPRGDLFAREIIGGMLDCEPDVIKKQGRWSRSDSRTEGFRKRWRKFDWTRVLTEGPES